MPRSGSPFITSMITDQIRWHEALLPINYKNYNIQEKNDRRVMKEMKNFH